MEAWQKLLGPQPYKPLLTPRRYVEDQHTRRCIDETTSRVRGLLARSNIRQVDIIRRYNINKSALSLVLNGKRKTLHIRQAIAKALNRNYSDVWARKSI